MLVQKQRSFAHASGPKGLSESLARTMKFKPVKTLTDLDVCRAVKTAADSFVHFEVWQVLNAKGPSKPVCEAAIVRCEKLGLVKTHDDIHWLTKEGERLLEGEK